MYEKNHEKHIFIHMVTDLYGTWGALSAWDDDSPKL